VSEFIPTTSYEIDKVVEKDPKMDGGTSRRYSPGDADHATAQWTPVWAPVDPNRVVKE
jgi:hypothetical protein